MAKQKESKQKKINVRVDFTPMVDMLMLLITFFMLCTSLSKSKTMDLTMPAKDKEQKEEQQNEAKESGAITLYLTADNKIYFGAGEPKYDDAEWIKETTWGKDGIRKVLREHTTGEGIKPVPMIEMAAKELRKKKKDENIPDSIFNKQLSDIKGGNLPTGKIETLTVIIKPTDNATYTNMIDALDEMQILEIGTYVIDKITPDDQKLLKLKGVEE